MIKMSRNLKSNRQALKILTTEGGWFKSRWTSVGDKQNVGNAGSENVNLAQTRGGATFDADQNVPQFAMHMHSDHSRVTKNGTAVPKTASNQDDGSRMVACVQTLDPLTGRVVMVAPDVGLREFSFDSVLHPKATQRSVYDASARRLVMDFINGFNSTAIVYGQTGKHSFVNAECIYFSFKDLPTFQRAYTGSGKTFSMFGTEVPDPNALPSARQETKGIVPRACEEIFAALEQRRLDPRGFCLQPKAVPQHHRGGQDRRHRVGQPLASDVGRAAVDRLVQPAGPFGEAGRGEQTDGADAH